MSNKLGSTGRYPQGKLNEDDEGEIKLAVGNKDGNVVIDFGTQVVWIAFPPEEAIRFGETIIKHAKEVKGEDNAGA